MKLLIKNGTVINPGDRKITKADVLVTDGVISKVAPGLKDTADETYDAKVAMLCRDLSICTYICVIRDWSTKRIFRPEALLHAWWIYDHRGNAEHKTGGR